MVYLIRAGTSYGGYRRKPVLAGFSAAMLVMSTIAVVATIGPLGILGALQRPAEGLPAVTDFNGDGNYDIAIGIPNEDIGNLADAGAVQVIYGSPSGLSATTPVADQLWSQDSANIEDVSEASDAFGSVFVSGSDSRCEFTEPNTEGPYYLAGAPNVNNVLGQGLPGERFFISGRVLSQNCSPVAGATLDIWQADSTGTYDLDGYTLRGKIQTDQNGRYWLDTVYPGKYLQNGIFRPEHIHVKVSAPGGPVLTTQLYFEEDPDRDGLVRDSLVMKTDMVGGLRSSIYNFVISTN